MNCADGPRRSESTVDAPCCEVTSSVPPLTVASPTFAKWRSSDPPSTVVFDRTLKIEPVSTTAPPATWSVPTGAVLPLNTGEPDVTVIEWSESPVRSFVVDCPPNTRSSPLCGTVPSAQLATLLQRALPPEPVHVRVEPRAAMGTRNRPHRTDVRRAGVMMALAVCQKRAFGDGIRSSLRISCWLESHR